MRGDIQDVKQAIAQALRSQSFLNVLAAVDAEKVVAMATPGPTQVFEGAKVVKTDQGFPVAEVIGVTTTYDATTEQAKVAVHEIQVIWTHVGDDELTITAQLERLVRATRDLFWPPEGPVVLPNVASAPLQLVREEYTALMQGLAHPFVQASGTTMQVPTLTL